MQQACRVVKMMQRLFSMRLRDSLQVVRSGHWSMSLSTWHTRLTMRPMPAILLQLGIHTGLPGITFYLQYAGVLPRRITVIKAMTE